MPGKEEIHKVNLSMEVEKYTVLNANAILLAGVPKKEEICEVYIGMEVEKKCDEEEYGVLNSN